MNIQSSSCEPMQVLMMPDYRHDNPYQTLLSMALETEKIKVHFPSGYQTKNVIFQNKFIEDEKIHLYFSAADVVVLPFERILTSGSIILAMSYGKPVIAPRLGSIPETLGAADWLLYDPDDERGLLHATKDSTQVDLNALGQLVSESCDRLDWSAIAQKTLQVYQR